MSKIKKDYYSILEVEYDATQQRIQEMYYYLVKLYHPDLNPKTGNLFNEISLAYKVLSDPIQRKKYDLLHHIGSFVILDKIKSQNEYNMTDTVDTYARDLEDTYNTSYKKGISLTKLKQKIYTTIIPINKSIKNLTEAYIETKYEEDKFDEETYDPNIDFPFNWFAEYSYYSDPKQQPIFEILHNFQNYRFENSIRCIFKRNILSIFGVFLVYFLSIFYLIRNKIFKNFKPTNKDFNQEHKYKWYMYLLNIQAKNKFWRTIGITCLLFILSVYKLIFIFLSTIYWIFDRIIKYFLLPIAVVMKYILFGAFIWILKIYGFKK